MSKESNFLIYCMERYRHFKGLSGADMAKTFENAVSMGTLQSILNRCIQLGDHSIVQDIDDYISSITGNGLGKA